MKQWQLQEAKAKLSQLVLLSNTKGPQGITVRGKEEAVIVSKKTYISLLRKKDDFVTFLTKSPLHGVSLNIERDKSTPRKSKELVNQ
jgi:prevent-host-death family protein